MTQITRPARSVGDPAAAPSPAGAVGCCGNPPRSAVTAPEPADSAGRCCGTDAQAQAAGSCCGDEAKAEAVAAGAGCCG